MRTTSRRIACLWAALIVLALAAPPAVADAEDRPWAEGVPEDEQEQALELFRQGNQFLNQSLIANAVDKYREALAVWDHPAIHYNLAVALMQLDQPLEVYKSLEKAMAYGDAPLAEGNFERAKNMKEVIEQRLTFVTIRSRVDGAVITLDGKQLFVAPGSWDGVLLAGEHTVRGTKRGYVPTNEVHDLEGGERVELDVPLFTIEELTRYERKWDVWVPYVVLGAGFAIPAAGSGLHVAANNNFDDFDAGIEACGGCTREDDPGLFDIKDKADRQQRAAIGLYAVGGAAVVAGSVLAYINRKKAYRLDEKPTQPGVTFAPFAGADATGVTASFRF